MHWKSRWFKRNMCKGQLFSSLQKWRIERYIFMMKRNFYCFMNLKLFCKTIFTAVSKILFHVSTAVCAMPFHAHGCKKDSCHGYNALVTVICRNYKAKPVNRKVIFVFINKYFSL